MCQIQCACGGSFSGTKFDLIGAGRGQYHAAPSQIQRHFNTKKHKKWIQENQQLCCEGEVYIGEGVYVEDEEEEELEVRHSRELEEWKADATEEELEEMKEMKSIMTLEEQKEAFEMVELCHVVELEVDEIEIDGITYYYCEETDTFYDPETQDKVVPNTIMKEWRDWTYKEIISL